MARSAALPSRKSEDFYNGKHRKEHPRKPPADDDGSDTPTGETPPTTGDGGTTPPTDPAPADPPSDPGTTTPPADGRYVIDPVTRIEGHLRIELEVKDGRVVNAWSSGMLYRGIETILQGRNPEDAWLFTQRLCGVCTYVHGSASVRCVENALNMTVPANARTVRNLLMGAQFLHDHVVHFYHLHALDWVDITSALAADPNQTAVLADNLAPGAQAIDFSAVKSRIQALVDSRQLGIFTGAYWPHDAYLLDPEENLLLAAHYLEALKLQVKAARMQAVFGGKNPHVQNLRVGGITCGREITSSRIAEFRALLNETLSFVENIYLPDVVLLAEAYPEWTLIGGSDNYLAFGEFPLGDSEPQSLFFPRGVIFDRGGAQPVDVNDIVEHVRHSWYEGNGALHPAGGETRPNFTALDTADRYSWLKAPRYQGRSMEVGPLARVLVACKQEQPQVMEAVNAFLKTVQWRFDQLYSTLGRTAARAIETAVIGRAMGDWLDHLAAGSPTYQRAAMPTAAAGCGLNEAPRGALGHWIRIENQAIGNYQMVVPSTWNFCPRCSGGHAGPAEAALAGTPVIDPRRPVEVLRTIHSLDPCIACAVHVIDPEAEEVFVVRAI